MLPKAGRVGFNGGWQEGGQALSKPITLTRRASGLLLHPTSLPGLHGCGDLGPEAHRFVDFLDKARQHWWQMLPIGPVDQFGCPYSARSSFAGSPMLVSLDGLYRDGLLSRADLKPIRPANTTRVNYKKAKTFRLARLRKAFEKHKSKPARSRAGLQRFVDNNQHWLDDWALFCACRDAHHGKPWWTWVAGLRLRKKPDLAAARHALADDIAFHTFIQYQFDKQWSALKKSANRKGIGLIGDIPIFVAHDSCDVWANPTLFKLDRNSLPKVISGAAPDAFSASGQLWEHPLYDWARHKASGYRWWVDRFEHALSQFDAVRVDHFLGFCRYWEVPYGDRDARRGRWRKGPGADLFQVLKKKLGEVPVIAEDLGILTQQAQDLRDQFGFPGMRVLQFAFDEDDSYHAPHNYPRHCVAYTGTHDNNTTRGWFRETSTTARKGELSQRQRALAYTQGKAGTIHKDLMRLALSSVANTAILPVQDVLGLAANHRMNIPGRQAGNWRWRLKKGQLNASVAQQLAEACKRYGRA